MFRRLFLLALLPIATVACSPVAGDQAPLMEPGDDVTPGLPEDGDGTLVPSPPDVVELTVRVMSDRDDLVVLVARETGTPRDEVLASALVEGGAAKVELPTEMTAAGTWRVMVRARTPDGGVGGVLDVAPATLLYDGLDFPGFTSGWRVWMPGDEAPRPLGDVTIGTRLTPSVSTALVGDVAGPVSEYEFAIGYREEIRAGDRGVTRWVEGDTWSVVDTSFVTSVAGPPSDPSPLRATWWPVAWLDDDGVVGFDGDSDDVVGELCQDWDRVGFVWVAPPANLAQASAILRSGDRVGWSAMKLHEGVWTRLDANREPSFELSCE